jgi:predicted metalloendopeptidase
MNIRSAGLLALATLGLAACNTTPKEEMTAQAMAVPAFDLATMDTTMAPCADFDTYVNGTWKTNNPVPSTESRWGSFVILAKENLEVKVKGIIDEVLAKKDVKKGSEDQLIADMYRSFMDTVTVEKLGATPLKPYFDRIDAMKGLPEYAALAGEYAKLGVRQFVGFQAEADMQHSDMNALYSGQDGLSLGERSYYEKTDSGMMNIRAEFVKHVDTLFTLAGMPMKDAGRTILAFETGLAKLQLTNIQTRNPDIYKRIAFADFAKLSPKIDLTAWAKASGINVPDSLLLEDRTYVETASAYVAAAPMATVKLWMKWKVLAAYAGSLNKAIDQEAFHFNSTVMAGTKQQRTRAERALRVTNGLLGEPLGKLYAERYFPASSRKRVEDMIENVRKVYGERIDGLAWMSPETKVKAHEKLAAFTTKIGYPDVWKDYSMVDITPTTLVQNTMNMAAWRANDNLSRVGKPVDPKEWGMTPQTVNAYYNPSRNEVVFPAGILQPPFFNADADDAINYGGIITVIGHELTHGFDDQGAKFDAKGNLVDWWTADDKKNFNALSQKLIAYFDGIEAMPGMHIKGGLTVGENIADLGGLTLSYYALMKSMEGKPESPLVDGFNWKQRFFLGYGQIWRQNITDQELRRRLEMDPHSPGRYRVNATLGQLKEFADVWCPGGGPMLVADSARVVIW